MAFLDKSNRGHIFAPSFVISNTNFVSSIYFDRPGLGLLLIVYDIVNYPCLGFSEYCLTSVVSISPMPASIILTVAQLIYGLSDIGNCLTSAWCLSPSFRQSINGAPNAASSIYSCAYCLLLFVHPVSFCSGFSLTPQSGIPF